MNKPTHGKDWNVTPGGTLAVKREGGDVIETYTSPQGAQRHTRMAAHLAVEHGRRLIREGEAALKAAGPSQR